MGNDKFYNRVGAERIDDRQTAEVIGIAHGIIADGAVSQAEAEYLLKWLQSRLEVTANPVVQVLYERVRSVMDDGVLDKEEAVDLMATLTAFAGGEFEAGELTKATTLPLCNPVPQMRFPGAVMTFTGTFAYGQRPQCEAAILPLGAVAGSLTAKTNYLVVGSYATDSWAQSSFGRKIEKAVGMRAKGIPINIIGEAHWVDQMNAR